MSLSTNVWCFEWNIGTKKAWAAFWRRKKKMNCRYAYYMYKFAWCAVSCIMLCKRVLTMRSRRFSVLVFLFLFSPSFYYIEIRIDLSTMQNKYNFRLEYEFKCCCQFGCSSIFFFFFSSNVPSKSVQSTVLIDKRRAHFKPFNKYNSLAKLLTISSCWEPLNSQIICIGLSFTDLLIVVF